MTFKSIMSVVTDMEADSASLEAARVLAKSCQAHLDVVCLGVDRTQPGFYYAGANALAMQTNLEAARTEAKAAEEGVTKALTGDDLPWATHAMTASSPGLGPVLAYQTRMADVAVLPQPYGENRDQIDEIIVESSLFDAGLPVIIVPKRGAFNPPFKRILLAWNESQESLRAIRAAMPLMADADIVNIAIIDPPVHAADRADPGSALSQLLSRHGVHAEVSVLSKTMPRVSDVLTRHADDIEADLLVMGAYGHSRFRESILGGATRNLLQSAEIPVLMAH